MEGLFGTILVSLILVAIVALIIWRMIVNKRAGKASCSMGCSGCSQKQSCIINSDQLYEDTEDKKELE